MGTVDVWWLDEDWWELFHGLMAKELAWDRRTAAQEPAKNRFKV